MTSDRPTILAVASGKGGVGKTLLASCLGSIINEQSQNISKVMVVDVDIGVKGLTFLYGSAKFWNNYPGGMIDILMGVMEAKDLLDNVSSFNGLVVIPAAVRFDSKICWDEIFSDQEDLARRIGQFIDYAIGCEFTHIIFDTGAGLDQITVALSDHVDKILVIVEPDEISLTAAIDLRAELLDHNNSLQFVPNKEPDTFPQKLYQPLEKEIVFLPSIPFDPALHRRFVANARLLSRTGFNRTLYKRYVGLIAKDLFGISHIFPTIFDRIFRKRAAKIFLRFLIYGFFFLVVFVFSTLLLAYLFERLT